MRKFKFAVVSLIAVIFSALFVLPGIASDEAVPGDVLVVFRKPASVSNVTARSLASGSYSTYTNSIASSVQGKVTKTYNNLSELKNGIFALIHSDTLSEEAMLEQLKRRSDVIGVSLNRKYKLYDSASEGVEPNDSMYPDLWGMEAIRAPEAWVYDTGADDIYVVVLDSGVDSSHEDLKANFETEGYSRSFVNDDMTDENGHGTHVAGTIGAVGNNEIGVAGVNWNTKIISLRAFDSGGWSFGDAIVQALDYLAGLLNDNPNLNIAAVNMSYGGGPTSTTPQERLSDPEYIAMSVLDETDRILMCIAAGNDYTEIEEGLYVYPASFTGLKNVITVAASNPDKSKADFSNYSTANVDIAAPGFNILSTAPTDSTLVNERPERVMSENGQTYLYLNGTSMATPHVTGTAALLKSAAPYASVSEIKAAILEAADTNYAADYTKYGYLDLKGALDILAPSDGTHIIRTRSLPDALEGIAYKAQLSMVNSSDVVTWELISGDLPEGLLLDNSSGVISGIPSKAGKAEFTVQAAGEGVILSRDLAITVYNDPTIITSSIPDGKLDVNYSAALTAKGSAPLTWSVSDDALPAGLELDESTGRITGTPSFIGTYTFTVALTNGSGKTAAKTFTMKVTDPTTRLEFATEMYVDAELSEGKSEYSNAALRELQIRLNPITEMSAFTEESFFVKSSEDVPERLRALNVDRKVRADNFVGTFTIGTGSSPYTIRYYDQNTYEDVTETIAAGEARTFSLTRNYPSYYPVTSEGMSVTFVGSSDVGLSGRHVDWIITGNTALNGSKDISMLSVKDQLANLAPYAELVSQDSEGRFGAAHVAVTEGGDVSKLVEMTFDGQRDFGIDVRIPLSSDNEDFHYHDFGFGRSVGVTKGQTVDEIISFSDWSWASIPATSFTIKEVNNIELHIYNAEDNIYYRWRFDNKNSWDKPKSEGVYLDVNLNTSITMSGDKPDYASQASSDVNMSLSHFYEYETPTSRDVRSRAVRSVREDADGVLRIGSGEGSYTHYFWINNMYSEDVVGSEPYDIALSGSEWHYELDGGFNTGADEALKGRYVSWDIKAHPEYNAGTSILDELGKQDSLMPYVEFVREGNTFTGIKWSFKDSSAVMKNDSDVQVYFETMQPYRDEDGDISYNWNWNEAYHVTVKAGDKLNGSYTFDSALPYRELSYVTVTIRDVSGSETSRKGMINYSYTFHSNESWQNTPQVGLRPRVYFGSTGSISGDVTFTDSIEENYFELHFISRYLEPSSDDLHIAALRRGVKTEDDDSTGSLTIKAGEGTYSYYDYENDGELVTVSGDERTFKLYSWEWGDDYYLRVRFTKDSALGLNGRTLEWTTDKWGKESAVLNMGNINDIVPYVELLNPNSKGEFGSVKVKLVEKTDHSKLAVMNFRGNINVSVYESADQDTYVGGVWESFKAGETVEAENELNRTVSPQKLNGIYVSVSDQKDIVYYHWNFLKNESEPDPISPDVSPDVPVNPHPTSPDVSPDITPTSPDVSPDIPPVPSSSDVSPDRPVPQYPDVEIEPASDAPISEAVLGFNGLSVYPRFARPGTSSEDVLYSVYEFLSELDLSADVFFSTEMPDESRDVKAVFDELKLELINQKPEQLLAVVLPEIEVDYEGFYLFRVPVDNIMRLGTAVFWHSYERTDTSPAMTASDALAVVSEDRILFIDDGGNFTNVISGEQYINVLVYLESGTYEPVITAEATSNDITIIRNSTDNPNVPPNVPVTPEQPNTPVTPASPDVSPDIPVPPVSPDVSPDVPVIPTSPDVSPDIPVPPISPDISPDVSPDVPVIPTSPDVSPDVPVPPTSPDIPVQPVDPDSPDVPVTPTSPDIPVTPTSPDVPVQPVSPDVPPDTPVTPTSPDISPDEPVTPTSPDVDPGNGDNNGGDNGNNDGGGTGGNETPEPEIEPEPLEPEPPNVDVEEVAEKVIEALRSLSQALSRIITENTEVAELPESASGSQRDISDLSDEDLEAIPESQTVVGVLPIMVVTRPAIYVFGLTLDNLDVGAPIALLMLSESSSASAGIFGSASDTEDAYTFLDDDGNEVTTVPANKHVNVAAYMEPGKTYAPVVTTETSSSPESPESPVDTKTQNRVSGSGGGCNSGIGSLMLLALLTFCVPFRKD